MKHASYLAALWLLSITPANAQNCGGMPAVNGVCIPADSPTSPLYQGYGREVQQRQGRLKLTWGAISVDAKTGDISVITERLSEAEAIRHVLQSCEANGGRACRKPFTYRDRCVALAWPLAAGDVLVTHTAFTIYKASESSMAGCASEGGLGCEVVYSACSDPVFVD